MELILDTGEQMDYLYKTLFAIEKPDGKLKEKKFGADLAIALSVKWKFMPYVENGEYKVGGSLDLHPGELEFIKNEFNKKKTHVSRKLAEIIKYKLSEVK